MDWVKVGEAIIVPISIALIGLVGELIRRSNNRIRKAAEEAAASVRPNGSGHKSLVHMTEDILMHLGEIRGDVKDLKQELEAHARSFGHAGTAAAALEAKAGVAKLEELMNLANEHHDKSHSEIMRLVLDSRPETSG